MKDYYSFAQTSIGFSHIAAQKVCQDCSMYDSSDDFSVIVVSDGHGSDNFTRSDRGSRFACEVALEAVQSFVQDLNLANLDNDFLRDDVVTQLCKYILLRWNARVDADAAADPFTEAEVEKVSDKYRTRYLKGEQMEHAYGATLILVILTRDFCLAIRNGDGQCVTVDRTGGFATPIPWNENCEFNVTTSLCDHEAIENFRFFYTTQLPAAVFIGSDGVDDSYASVEELYNLYRNICLKALNDGVETVEGYVGALLPELTRRGSADDVSIAGALNLQLLEEAKTPMEVALEVRQMRLEEERREQQLRILARDIKMAEKKRAKILAQRLEVQQKMQGVQASKRNFLEQILAFKRRADACEENMAELTADEKQLTDLIGDVDNEIAQLKEKLLTMNQQIQAAGKMDTREPVEVPSAQRAAEQIEEIPCSETQAAAEPEEQTLPE